MPRILGAGVSASPGTSEAIINPPTSPRNGPARLGFGTSFLPGTLARSEALALLSAAYDSGIRHFDVAPLYGWGAAEELFGAFSAGKSDLKIVTKAGIAAPSKVARLIAKAPGLPSARAKFGQFNPGQVSRSLENSLSRLGVEGVDALLLHEAPAALVTDELVGELQRLKQSGKTLKLGLATSATDARAVQARFPDVFDLVQIPVAELGELGSTHSLIVLHSVLGRRLKALADHVSGDPELADELAQNLLRAALSQSRGGIVLFSSTRPEHVRHNAQLTAAEPELVARIEQALADAPHLQSATR